MANSPKATSANVLLAVLAGAAMSRRKREYWAEKVIKSSLYPVYDKDGAATEGLSFRNVNIGFVNIDDLTTTGIAFGSVELRSAQLTYKSDSYSDFLVSQGIVLHEIELASTLLPYESSYDLSTTSGVELNSIELIQALLRLSAYDTHTVNTGGIELGSITLTVEG